MENKNHYGGPTDGDIKAALLCGKPIFKNAELTEKFNNFDDIKVNDIVYAPVAREFAPDDWCISLKYVAVTILERDGLFYKAGDDEEIYIKFDHGTNDELGPLWITKSIILAN